jgi:large subunit ribosomal protein L25
MDATLEAVSRNRFGKNEAGRIRREGQIPAVVYGEAHAAESVSVNPKDLLRILHSESGANTLISLKIDGKGDHRVLVKEYQLHPVEQNLLARGFLPRRDGQGPARHRAGASDRCGEGHQGTGRHR